MELKEIVERSQALQLEFCLLKKELRDYGNEHMSDVEDADPNYLHKANNYPGDITPARIARVSNKLLYPK